MAKKLKRAVLKTDLRLKKGGGFRLKNSVELMMRESPKGSRFIALCKQIASRHNVTYDKVKEVASEIRNEWLRKYG